MTEIAEIKGVLDTNPKGMQNIFWLIIDNSKNVIIVDPGNADLIMEALKKDGLSPDSILITHNHNDHVAGINDITEEFHCPVIGPENEEIESITQAFTEGDAFERMGIQFEVLSLPGHSPDHIGFLANGEHFFCGDVLFGAGCGIVPEGSYDMMFESLQKCTKLSKKTKLYWGHEYTAANLAFASKIEANNSKILTRLEQTQRDIKEKGFSAPGSLQEEYDTNPFLRTDQPDVIAAAKDYNKGELSTPSEVFAVLRRWKTAGD